LPQQQQQRRRRDIYSYDEVVLEEADGEYCKGMVQWLQEQ